MISENHSAVELYTGSDIKQLFPLQHLPTKESHDFYTLSDIMVNGQNLNNEVINILAVIRTVRAVACTLHTRFTFHSSIGVVAFIFER